MREECRHKETVKLKYDRLNYPFGRKSKPRHSLRRVKEVCARCGQTISDYKVRNGLRC